MEKETEKISFFKRRKKLIIVVAVFLVAGFIGWRLLINRGNGEVETATIERGDVATELVLSGSLKATQHANLPFLSSGEIAAMLVSPGDAVVKGQTLATLDTIVLNASLQQARSNLRSADATVERVHDDVKDHDDDESFDQKETRTTAEVAKDNAYELVLIAEKNLVNASLRAPFDGVIADIVNPFTRIGTLATQSQIEVVNPSTIYFEVVADQGEVIEIKTGQKAVIVLDSYSEDGLVGTVDFVGITPLAAEAGTSYEVIVKFGEGTFNLEKYKIGMTGDAKFILSESRDVLYIPSDFLNSDKEGKYVNLSSKNNKVYVEIGAENDEIIEIIGDIQEGDVVFD